MPPEPDSIQSDTLSLEERWTLHHALLQCIEREASTPEREPPAIEVYQAFETLDTGTTNFTTAQLEAIQDVLAESHHRTDQWQLDRPQVESLLDHVTTALEESQPLET